MRINFYFELVGKCKNNSVADLGFPVGRGGMDPLGGGHGPLTRALFAENVCENKRIGSHWEGALGIPP